MNISVLKMARNLMAELLPASEKGVCSVDLFISRCLHIGMNVVIVVIRYPKDVMLGKIIKK
jgi:hypothetical protein